MNIFCTKLYYCNREIRASSPEWQGVTAAVIDDALSKRIAHYAKYYQPLDASEGQDVDAINESAC
eukprot:8041-Heterococcus_DN1.PRE.1